MGEPLLNLDAVGAAIDVLGEWISLRRITVSTVGVVPGIRRHGRAGSGAPTWRSRCTRPTTSGAAR